MDDLINALRLNHDDQFFPFCNPAADLIEAQAAEIARLREALDTIKGEMQFPNQLEVGFVHGPITLKDACRRVELARGISSQALQETANDPA